VGPAQSLDSVPTSDQIAKIVKEEPTFWLEGRLRSPESLLAQYGWALRRRVMDTPEVHALLIQLRDGSRSVVLNKARGTSKSDSWLIAHEVAHSLLFSNGRRWLPPSSAEEDFCDAFATFYMVALGTGSIVNAA